MPADDTTQLLDEITAAAASEIVHPDAECDGRDCTPHGALRMAAALRAVLELAAGTHAVLTADCTCSACEEARENGFTGIHRQRDVGWNLDPAKVREAITTRLLGEGDGDGR